MCWCCILDTRINRWGKFSATLTSLYSKVTFWSSGTHLPSTVLIASARSFGAVVQLIIQNYADCKLYEPSSCSTVRFKRPLLSTYSNVKWKAFHGVKDTNIQNQLQNYMYHIRFDQKNDPLLKKQKVTGNSKNFRPAETDPYMFISSSWSACTYDWANLPCFYLEYMDAEFTRNLRRKEWEALLV